MFTAHRLLAEEWLGLESSPCSAGQVMPRVWGGLHLTGCLFLICTRVPHEPGVVLSLPLCLLPNLMKSTPSLSPSLTAGLFLTLSSGAIRATPCPPSSVFHPAAVSSSGNANQSVFPFFLELLLTLQCPQGRSKSPDQAWAALHSLACLHWWPWSQHGACPMPSLQPPAHSTGVGMVAAEDFTPSQTV